MKKVRVIIEAAPNNYAAYIEGIDGIGVTGETIDIIKERIRSGIDFLIECCQEDGCEIPEPLQGKYELEYHIDVKTFLSVYSGIFTKSGLERLTGVNQKQLWHYANGTIKPRKKQRERIERAVHRLGYDLVAFTL